MAKTKLVCNLSRDELFIDPTDEGKTVYYRTDEVITINRKKYYVCKALEKKGFKRLIFGSERVQLIGEGA